MTKVEACEQTRNLWTKIAHEAEQGRCRQKHEIPGPWRKYIHCCPCCQYVYLVPRHMEEGSPYSEILGCTICPMAPEWKNFPLHRPYDDHYYCEIYLTPYLKWRWLTNEVDMAAYRSCYDIAFFAWMIVELAEDAIKRIKGENIKDDRNTA